MGREAILVRLGITGMVSIPGGGRAPNVLWQQC
jgi:hypothetical protein